MLDYNSWPLEELLRSLADFEEWVRDGEAGDATYAEIAYLKACIAKKNS
jgi:hypothetical protein